MTSKFTLSVVICVYNEENNIAACLHSIVAQTRRPDEILFVDDYCTDNTIDIARSFVGHLPIKIIRNSGVKGLRPARALGVKEAKGDIKITMDADEVLDERCIETLEYAFTDPSVGAAGGTVIQVGGSWIANGEQTMQKITANFRIKDSFSGFVCGGCAAYRSEVLEKIGGLSTDYLGEDVDASWRIRNLGYKVWLTTDALVYHKGPTTLKGLLRTKYDLGKRAFALYCTHKSKLISWKLYAQTFPFLVFLISFVSWKIALFLFFAVLIIIAFYDFQDPIITPKKDRSVYLHVIDSFLAWIVFQIGNIAWTVGLLSRGLLVTFERIFDKK